MAPNTLTWTLFFSLGNPLRSAQRIDSEKVKTVIYEEADWLERHRIAAYIVLYVQFLQMVLAFNVHPRVAMLTSTITKLGDHDLIAVLIPYAFHE